MTVNVLWLFLVLSWVGLLCVIVVSPGHTNYFLRVLDQSIPGNHKDRSLAEQ